VIYFSWPYSLQLVLLINDQCQSLNNSANRYCFHCNWYPVNNSCVREYARWNPHLHSPIWMIHVLSFFNRISALVLSIYQDYNESWQLRKSTAHCSYPGESVGHLSHLICHLNKKWKSIHSIGSISIQFNVLISQTYYRVISIRQRFWTHSTIKCPRTYVQATYKSPAQNLNLTNTMKIV
jgi:hypothetical protein